MFSPNKVVRRAFQRGKRMHACVRVNATRTPRTLCERRVNATRPLSTSREGRDGTERNDRDRGMARQHTGIMPPFPFKASAAKLLTHVRRMRPHKFKEFLVKNGARALFLRDLSSTPCSSPPGAVKIIESSLCTHNGRRGRTRNAFFATLGPRRCPPCQIHGVDVTSPP